MTMPSRNNPNEKPATCHGTDKGHGKPRIWNGSGFVPFHLEALTPVYIGSGEDFSPLDYIIRRVDGQECLFLVDTGAWLLEAQGNSAVSAALEKGDLPALRRLLNEDKTLDSTAFGVARINFASEVVAEDLKKIIANPQSGSKAEIMAFVRNPYTQTAFVPGSSIKGALSTPLIDFLDKKRHALRQETLLAASMADERASKNARKEYNAVMRNLFGDISEHAMQALKAGDVSIPPGGTRIFAAKEMRLSPLKKGTPKTPCEALVPDSGITLRPYGSLRLDTRAGSAGIALPGSGGFIKFEQLCAICNEFYRSRFMAEWQKFYQLAHFRQVRQSLESAASRIRSLDPAREMLLRIGHYSHVECVTVEHNRPRTAKGWGKTRTLADGLLPFGWVILRICGMEEYLRGKEAVDDAIDASLRRRLERLEQQRQEQAAALERERQLTAARRKRLEDEQEHKRLEAEANAAREAALAGLDTEERAIRLLSFDSATEEQAARLFAELDSMSETRKRQAAEALMAFWKKLGKWEGKGLSKKQQQKVDVVRTIIEHCLNETRQ